ncbi:aminotransferase-like domain-containing protein [Aeromonas aquatilis]
MPLFTLDPRHGTLVRQLMFAIEQGIREYRLHPASRLPSVRQLASQLGISTFTVADAYSRLAHSGHLLARPGDGYYVAREEPSTPFLPRPTPGPGWLTDHRITPAPELIQPGAGWLPPDWYPNGLLQKALRQQARDLDCGGHYEESAGWQPLRQRIWSQHEGLGSHVTPDGVLLTQGASQALSLVVQSELRPGETVLVDDPGYCNLIALLEQSGMRVVGVPWTPQGPDCQQLATLLNAHSPRLFFTNPRLHNPTGASYSASTAFRVLQLAEVHDCLIVEDDVSAPLVREPGPTLAALAGLERVIYIGSFAKTLAPGLRVGYLLGSPERVDRLMRLKAIHAISSCGLAERLVLRMLGEPERERELVRLRDRLRAASERWERGLARIGWQHFCPPAGGLFSWVRLPADHQDAAKCAEDALAAGFLLAPGSQFRQGQPDTPWLRCNLAYSPPSLLDFLQRWADQ